MYNVQKVEVEPRSQRLAEEGGCGLSTRGKDHYYASATFTFYFHPKRKNRKGGETQHRRRNINEKNGCFAKIQSI